MALGQNCFNFPEASNSSGALSRFLLVERPSTAAAAYYGESVEVPSKRRKTARAEIDATVRWFASISSFFEYSHEHHVNNLNHVQKF